MQVQITPSSRRKHQSLDPVIRLRAFAAKDPGSLHQLEVKMKMKTMMLPGQDNRKGPPSITKACTVSPRHGVSLLVVTDCGWLCRGWWTHLASTGRGSGRGTFFMFRFPPVHESNHPKSIAIAR
jgi:hypothetical protein